jgi:hypothetical protein
MSIQVDPLMREAGKMRDQGREIERVNEVD